MKVWKNAIEKRSQDVIVTHENGRSQKERKGKVKNQSGEEEEELAVCIEESMVLEEIREEEEEDGREKKKRRKLSEN